MTAPSNLAELCAAFVDTWRRRGLSDLMSFVYGLDEVVAAARSAALDEAEAIARHEQTVSEAEGERYSWSPYRAAAARDIADRIAAARKVEGA